MVTKIKGKINLLNSLKHKLKVCALCAIFTLGLFISFLILPVSVVLSADLPENPVVQVGNPAISSDGRDMVINAGQYNKTWVDWSGGFNIGAQNSVNNIGPDASAIMLHRDTSGAISDIVGVLKGNCNVFLLNPNGILFAPGAQINVGGLVASTLHMSLDDFVSGNYMFSSGEANLGSIVNAGSIAANNPGGVTLIAGALSNEGVISANLGTVNLISGKEVTLDINGEGSIQATVNKAVLNNVYDKEGNRINTGVKNTGTINATGGQVYIKAEAVKDVFDNLINQEGVIKAGSMVQRNGKIVLVSDSDGIVQNSGTLDASAVEAGAKGGTVQILGEKVGLLGEAKIDVSGDAGGGTVLVGGDYQGKNPDVRNASVTYMSKDATINADAINNGDGGRIIIWSDNATRAYGLLSVDGGVEAGNGGFIETSSRNWMDVNDIKISAGAACGKACTWLLDPESIEITGATTNITVGGADPLIYSPTAIDTVTTLNAATINAALDTGVGVTVDTSSAGTTTPGKITVTSAILKSADPGGDGSTLTLDADNDIEINNTISSTSGVLNVVLTALAGVDVGAAIDTNGGTFSSTGTTFTNAGGTITTSDGAGGITINHSGAVTIGAALLSAAGNVDIDSTGSTVAVNQGITTTTGNVTIDSAVGSTTTVAAAGDIQTTTGIVTFGGTRADNLTTSGDITTSTGGNITFTRATTLGGNVNVDAGNQTFTSSSTINTQGNDLSITADTIALGGNFSGTGNLTLQPDTVGQAIGIGTDAAGAFSLTDTEVGYINNGATFTSITIGRSDGTGLVTVNPGTGTTTFSDPITIRSGGAGGSITVNEIFTTAASNSAITFTAGSGDSGIFTLTAGAGNTISSGSGAIIISADSVALNTTADTITSTGAITLQPSTTARPIVLAGAGAATDFALTQAEIDSVTTGYSSITIGKSAGTGTLKLGGAVDLAGETAIIRSGQINDAVNAITATNLTLNLSSTTGANVARTTVTTFAADTSGGDSATNDSLTLVDTAGGVDLATSNIGDGNLTVTATTGNITDSATITVGGTASFTTSQADADINLGTLAVTGNIYVNTNGATGNATLVNATALNFTDTSTVGGALNATATTGNLTDAGTLTVGGTSTFTTSNANDDIVINGLAGTGAISLNTNGATGNAALVNTIAVDLALSNVGGALTATATTGNMTDSGLVTVGGAGSFTTSQVDADINLGTLAVAGDITLSTSGTTGNATIVNTVATTLAASTIGGNLDANSSNNSFVVSGALSTAVANGSLSLNAGTNTLTTNAGGTLASGSGAITLTSDAVALGDTITGTGNITLTPSTASTGIGIGTGAAGAYNLNTTEIGYLVNGFNLITIGNAAGTGAIDIQAITFHDPVTIRSPAGAGSITVNGLLQDDHGSGTLTLDGPGATTTLNADIVTDRVAIHIDDNLIINGAARTLDTTNGAAGAGANITIDGTTDSTATQYNGLTLDAGTGGNITLTGSVGSGVTQELGGITITQANDVTFRSTIEASWFDQTDSQGTTTFSGDVTTTGTTGGYGIDGRSKTNIHLDDNVDLNSSSNPIRLRSDSFTFDPGATITGSSVTLGPYTAATAIGVEDNTKVWNVTDAMLDVIVGPVTIGDATTGAITIANGAAGGNINLTQNKNLTFISGSTINLIGVGAGPAITTTSGGAVTFTNAGILTINAAGDLSLDGAFLQDGAGLVSTAGDITTTADAITFTTGTTLTGSIALSNGGGANTGDIWFKSSLTGTTTSTENLTLTAGAGSIKMDGLVGATRLGDILINNAFNFTPALGVSAKTLTQTTGTGTTQFSDNIDITGNIGVHNGIINVGSAANVTSASGNIDLESLTGSMALSGNLTAVGNTVTLTSAANITDTTSSDTDITANSLTITANSGSVGASGANNQLDTDVNTITASAGNNIYIYQKKAVALPSIVATAGVVDIEAAGTITSTIVSANGGYAVNLYATSGDILDTVGGLITGTSSSTLRAPSGLIGTTSNPLDVKITGSLWVLAGLQQNEVSVILIGSVNSGAATERVEIFEPAPPGLVILNNRLMGGSNYGSGSNRGSILSRGYGYTAIIRSEILDAALEQALGPWGNNRISLWSLGLGTNVGENLLSFSPAVIDVSKYNISSASSFLLGPIPLVIDVTPLRLPELQMEIDKTANYCTIRSLK